MLKRWLFLLTTLCLPFLGEAKVIQTAHIADVIPLIDADTWFLVDLDNTMFEAKQALGHNHWFSDEMEKRLEQGMSREEAIRDVYPGWIKTQKVCPVQPLEPDFVPSLMRLQNNGIVIMGFTHRQPCVADSTLRQVESLNFDFMKTAPSKETFSVPSKTPTLYSKGILFVGDYNKKSDILIPFLSIIQKKPKKVVFIDDKKKNVDELEPVLAQQGIEYIGVFYTAFENVKPIFSREIAEFQYKFLDTIISNEAAQFLMEHGVE